MAMARSSLKGVWNLSCEGGAYLYTQGKMGASVMFQTWRRVLICLLVLASLPFSAPMIIVSVMVGGVFLVPVLAGVAAFYALFRPASLSKTIQWFRSPKSGLRSGSTELVMEDLDRDPGASLGISDLDRQESEEAEDSAFHFDDQEREDQSMTVEPSDKDEIPILETTQSGIPLEELNPPADEEEPSQAVQVIDNQQEQVEEPEQLEEGLAPEEGLLTGDEAPIVQDKGIEKGVSEVEEEDGGAPALLSEVSVMEQRSLPMESEPVKLASPIPAAPASASVEESCAKEAPVGDEEKEKAEPVVESSAPTMDQQSLPVDSEPVELASSVMDVPTIAEPAPVQEAAALVENLVVKETEVPEAPMEVEEPEVSDPDVAREAVRTEDKGLHFAQEKEVASELVSEESEVPVVEDKDAQASSLESEVSMMEVQRSLPVVSEPVDLASPIPDVPAIDEAAPASASVEESCAKEVPMGDEEKEKSEPVVESSASVMDQQSLPVDSEPVEVASSVMDIPTIAEPAPVQEAAALVEELDAKETEVPEAPLVQANEVAEAAATEDKGLHFVQEKEVASELVSEESEVPAVEDKDAQASSLESEVSMMEVQHSLPVVSEPVDLASPVADVPAIEEAALMEEAAPVEVYTSAEEDSETPVEEIKVPVVALEEPPQPEAETTIAKEVKASPAASEGTEEAGGDVELPSIVSKPVTEEKETPVVAEDEAESEPLVVEEKSVLEEEAAPAEDVALVGEGIVEKGEESEAPALDVKETNEPEAALQETLTEEDTTPEVEAPIAELEVTKEAQAGPATSEEAQIVQDKVELPPAVSEPVSEDKEAPGGEESLQEVHVEAAPVEGTLVNKLGKTEASAVGRTTEGADVNISSQVDCGSEANTVETSAPLYKDIVAGFKSQDHGSDDTTTPEGTMKLGRGGGHDRIPSDLEPPSTMAASGNLDQAPKDRTTTVSNLELEAGAPLTSPNEDVQKLEENLVVESQIEEDVFPALKPLNVVQSKDPSSHDSTSTRAPVQRRISFEEVNTGALISPSYRTDVQGKNFISKSRLGRHHRTHRHSAPDFLSSQAWVHEAPPQYSPQESVRGHKKAKSKKWSELEGARPARSFSVSDSGDPQMGEFESLLQSWQERDKATQSPTSASPSGSPRSPAEIGRQIREEICTIQKIIGQEVPPQYSLWKEVETLCQIVGIELPYMGDVSDLTKARHGLDLLKVVVGIKWT